ncbi:hypothetical protein XENOCAPTIV_004150 [Xenoophorus captivus]|uniref:Secreted protein n=1 Tax=Xenoophorus captivus TaxID=1517983 RepID=A0ABV0SD83_9TELE
MFLRMLSVSRGTNVLFAPLSVFRQRDHQRRRKKEILHSLSAQSGPAYVNILWDQITAGQGSKVGAQWPMHACFGSLSHPTLKSFQPTKGFHTPDSGLTHEPH